MASVIFNIFWSYLISDEEEEEEEEEDEDSSCESSAASESSRKRRTSRDRSTSPSDAKKGESYFTAMLYLLRSCLKFWNKVYYFYSQTRRMSGSEQRK